jgi:hypothetical protein
MRGALAARVRHTDPEEVVERVQLVFLEQLLELEEQD